MNDIEVAVDTKFPDRCVYKKKKKKKKKTEAGTSSLPLHRMVTITVQLFTILHKY